MDLETSNQDDDSIIGMTLEEQGWAD
jgi:hypothetical protein